jgi:hypothetical protein
VNLLALDPGSEKTAWLLFDGGEPVEWGHDDNGLLRAWMIGTPPFAPPDTLLAVEYMRPRGMPTSQEEMDTMFELGRMVQAWGREWKPVSRHEVKMHICGSARANDATIRAALIDRFGGASAIAPEGKCERCRGRGKVGRGKARVSCGRCLGNGKGTPAGILHGISGDVWSALAVAVTAAETAAQAG